ncbi:MAG: hypothetical protein QW478_15755 [Candidatus Micrarchaeaceae archaeon]
MNDDILKKKFDVDIAYIKEIANIQFNKFSNYKKELIQEIVRRSYELLLKSGYTENEIISPYNNDKPKEIIVSELRESVNRSLVEKSRKDSLLAESLVNKSQLKKHLLSEYFIKTPKINENGSIALDRLVLESLIDSLIDVNG